MKEITYDKDILNFIKNLSDKLTKEMILRKSGDKLVIRKNEKSISTFVDFSTPVSNFDFEGEVLGFAEGVFSEFHKFYNLFENPSLFQDGPKLILKQNKQTIKFSTSDPDIIKNELKEIKQLPKPLTSFNLTEDQFLYLRKMIKMVLKMEDEESREVQFVAKGKEISVSLTNNVNKNSSNVVFELEEEVQEETTFVLNTVVFDLAPALNYTINILPTAKMFQFSSVNEKFSLNLYTGLRIA